ncbi:MAG TPA: ketoacyl-synthetase C-terminal extension domain-containing protein, partial [Ignavibacteriaceae bacterium]
GGVNGHVLLDANHKELDENCLQIADKIPRLVNVCARNEESLKELFDFIEKNPNKITRDFLALITDTMKIKPLLNSSGFPFRGLNESICYRIQNKNFFLIIRYNAYKESQWTRKI